MALEVRYSERALADLLTIFDWVAAYADEEVALAYITRIRARCASLSDFPTRGTPRGAGGERSIPFERRATILYRPGGSTVDILGICHAGREL